MNTPEHFKETDWSGLYIGSEGTIINQTGCKVVQYFHTGHYYVGIEANKKRYLRKLANMVMEFYIRDGRKLPEDMMVGYIDNDPTNCKASNLKIIPKKGPQWCEHRPYRLIRSSR